MQAEDDGTVGEPESLVPRLRHLEVSLKKSEEECVALRKENEKLSKELERCDAMSAKAIDLDLQRLMVIGELRQKIAQLEREKANKTEENQGHHDTAQHTMQLDKLRRDAATEIRNMTEEFVTTKDHLLKRIEKTEKHLCLRTKDMNLSLLSKELEFKRKMDAMRRDLFNRDTKIMLLKVKLGYKVKDPLDELEEVTASKNKRIKEVEEARQQLEIKLKMQMDEHEKKYEDVACALKECEEQLEAERQAHKQQIRQAEKHIVKLQNEIKLDSAKAQSQHKEHQEVIKQNAEKHQEFIKQKEEKHQEVIKQKEEKHQEVIKQKEEKHQEVIKQKEKKYQEVIKQKEKKYQEVIKQNAEKHQEVIKQNEMKIQRLDRAVKKTEAGWEQCIADISREIASKDKDGLTLQERQNRQRNELEKSREEIERYKNELTTSLSRERSHEQKLVQLELDWQKRCENLKSEHYRANDRQIRDLTEDRDAARNKVVKRDLQVYELREIIHSMMLKDKAVKPCHCTRGTAPAPDLCAAAETSPPTQAVPPPQPMIQASLIPSSDRYTIDLEEEVRKLKRRCWNLEEQLEEAQRSEKGKTLALEEEVRKLKRHCKNLEEPQGGARGSGTYRGQEYMGSPLSIILMEILKAPYPPGCVDIQHPPLNFHKPDHPLKTAEEYRYEKAWMKARLKRAGYRLLQVCKEKQELIRLNNELEGNRRIQEEQNKNRMDAVQQHQYRLTMKELQFARQTFSVCHKATNTEPQCKEESERHPQSPRSAAVPAARSARAENMEMQGDPALLHSNSEESQQPLNEIWDMLDHRLSVSEAESDRSIKNMANLDGAGMTWQGTRATIYAYKFAGDNPLIKNTTTKTKGPGASERKSRIRNYNIKD